MALLSVDYNLLKPLRALLEERSVTRAAQALGVSQPTMSIALRRLRAHFGDPLLVRKGNAHELSPLGSRLLGMLPATVGEVERIFQSQSRFDPAHSTRSFVIAGVDHAISRVGPALGRAVQQLAPHVQLEFPVADSALVNGAPDSLRSLDGVILPHGYLVEQPHLDLMSDEWACIVDVDSELGDEPTADELLARSWVHTLAAREGMTPARRQLQIQGIDVSVAAVTPYFHVVPALVEGTDRVALLPRTLAARAVERGAGIRLVRSPFRLEPIRDAFWWHPDREHDSDHVWLRHVLSELRPQLIADPDDGHAFSRLPL